MCFKLFTRVSSVSQLQLIFHNCTYLVEFISFYAFVTVRHCRRYVFMSSVRVPVRPSIRTLFPRHLLYALADFLPVNFRGSATWDKDELIGIWVQKVKSHSHRAEEYIIHSSTLCVEF